MQYSKGTIILKSSVRKVLPSNPLVSSQERDVVSVKSVTSLEGLKARHSKRLCEPPKRKVEVGERVMGRRRQKRRGNRGLLVLMIIYHWKGQFFDERRNFSSINKKLS